MGDIYTLRNDVNNRKTLGELGFDIGDFLDVSITKLDSRDAGGPVPTNFNRGFDRPGDRPMETGGPAMHPDRQRNSGLGPDTVKAENRRGTRRAESSGSSASPKRRSRTRSRSRRRRSRERKA